MISSIFSKRTWKSVAPEEARVDEVDEDVDEHYELPQKELRAVHPAEHREQRRARVILLLLLLPVLLLGVARAALEARARAPNPRHLRVRASGRAHDRVEANGALGLLLPLLLLCGRLPLSPLAHDHLPARPEQLAVVSVFRRSHRSDVFRAVRNPRITIL